MSMSDHPNNLGFIWQFVIWYHSEPLDVPYSPNQYTEFFDTAHNKAALHSMGLSEMDWLPKKLWNRHFFSGALFLSLKYEFVTPLTSLVVSVPEATKEGALSEAIGGHNRRHTITFSSAYSFDDGTQHLLCLIAAFLIVFQWKVR